jgi:hypothetical protein
MALKSGDDFNKDYEGSTGLDGQTRIAEAGGWFKSGDTYFKPDGNGGEYISKEESATQRGKNHMHYFDNKAEGHEHHKDGYEEGERLSSNKTDSQPASRDLFGNIKYFLGFDD